MDLLGKDFLMPTSSWVNLTFTAKRFVVDQGDVFLIMKDIFSFLWSYTALHRVPLTMVSLMHRPSLDIMSGAPANQVHVKLKGRLQSTLNTELH